MKTKTKIENQLKKKTNPIVVETVILAKKNPAWNELAHLLTMPGRMTKDVNLTDIEKFKGELIVVPGKVLSEGEITKKVKIAAINYSKQAKEKLLKAGCELSTIKELIEKNKDAKGVKILRK